MMSASEEPFYVSPRSSRSIWQEYRIYPDRLELQCWVAFHTLVIPAEEIIEIEVRPPIVIADLFRGKSFLYSFPLKIDGADGHRHVAIKLRENADSLNISASPRTILTGLSKSVGLL
jgi:hypothetical protein